MYMYVIRLIHDYIVTHQWSIGLKFDMHKKAWEGLLYENGAGKKIAGHSKLKLWTFFWGHSEHEWPLVNS